MFLLSACLLCSTLAALPTASPTPTPLPEIAHVTTASRYDSTLKNTARTTYVIDRATIERNGYRTIAQALQDVPALVSSPLGAIGALQDITLRGSSSAQTLVLIDGLPAPGTFSNSVELGNLPTSGVQRIEVVEGGGSTLYGEGAIGGIINIITDRKAPSGLILRAGSFNDNEIQVSTPYVQYDRIVAGNDFALPDGTKRNFSDYESTALHANADKTVGAFDVTARAGIESHHLGVPGPLAFLTPSAREYDDNRDADLTVAHNSAQAAETLQAGATQQHISYFCDAVNDAACFQQGIALSTDARITLALRNVVRGGSNTLVYGADLSHATVSINDGYGDPVVASPLWQTAAYAEEHVDTPGASWYGGVRAERDGVLGGEISPSLGFVVRPAKELSLKGNIATAFRAPNATELYYPHYGNANLAPERAQVADLTLVDSSLAGGVSLGWFGNRTRNLIETTPVAAVGPNCTPGIVTSEACNVAHAFVEGLTFTASTPAYKGITASLGITDLYRAENLDTQARLPNDPVFNTTLRLDYTASRNAALQAVGIAARSSGARGPVDMTQPLFTQPQAFTSIDAYASFRVGAHELLTLRGYNLGDERYAASAGFPLPGRSFLVELSAK